MSAATQNTFRPQETTRLIHLDLWPLAHSSIQLSSLCPSAGAISKVHLQRLSQVSQLSSGISALPPGSTESCVCPQASLNAWRGYRALSKGSGGADSLVEGWSKGPQTNLLPCRSLSRPLGHFSIEMHKTWGFYARRVCKGQCDSPSFPTCSL